MYVFRRAGVKVEVANVSAYYDPLVDDDGESEWKGV